MGQIIIEIPQHFDRNYRIVSHDSAEGILSEVGNLVAQSNFVEPEEIKHLWSEREETGCEIARNVRRSWKRNLWIND